MNRLLTMLIAGAFAVSLGACNKAEDPAEAQTDVAATQAEPTQDMAQAPSDMSQGTVEGQGVQGEGDAALVKAESDHKFAIEQCDALPADQQKACKDEADATFEAAKSAAELPGPS